jgi:hypothetical protein
LEARDALEHGPTKVRREPGAHFPSEPELPVVVVADEKRVEALRRIPDAR